MKKVLLTFVLIFFYIINGFSQGELDAYKYIIVPTSYSKYKSHVWKEDDKYKLNTLTVFLFKKKGFQTFMDGENFPADLIQNPCLALTVQMADNSNLFTTKVNLELENCQKKVVYTSKTGTSKEKDYQKSYQEALRNTFTSIENMDYSYNPDLKPVLSEKASAISAVQTDAPVKEAVPDMVAVTVPIATSVTEQPVQPQAFQTAAQPKISVAEPVVVPTVVPVAASVPVTVTATEESKQPVPAKTADRAHAYKNNELSFLLIPSGDGYQAYISDSKVPEFKKGEVLGNLRKTSLPNVFRVSWKNREGKPEDTTGYFDEKGSLVIDVQDKNGEIKTLVFVKE